MDLRRSVVCKRYQLGRGFVNEANTAKHLRMSTKREETIFCPNRTNSSTELQTQSQSKHDFLTLIANVYHSDFLTNQYHDRESEQIDGGSYCLIEAFRA